MASFRLSTTIVHSGHYYTLQLSEQVTVGETAQYLSQYESHLAVSTLEIARPVQISHRLQDIDIQTGDRLIVFIQPAKHAELPASLRPGDKTLKFSLGDSEISSRGKKGVLVGKPDESEQVMPDIDLRYFIPPEHLEFISRGCLWLNFDEADKTWYVSRMGQTRVMIDEFELGADKIPLNDDQWLRFYRGTDDPRQSANRPIGELRLTVEEVQSHDGIINFEPGNQRLNVQVGSERESQTLNVSENLRIGQVATSLALYNDIPLTPEARLFLARLLPPDAKIQTLKLGKDEFLYTALNPRYARNLLLLRDIHDHSRVYTLPAGMENAEKFIGCRAHSDATGLSPDVDLYGAIVGQGHDPSLFSAVSRYQGRILYRAAENTWWLGLAEQARMPIFVNNTRVTGSALIMLTSGDVLSFGPSVNDYYVRLEVEITAKID